MKIERFEDIISWKKAREVTVRIYQLFSTSRDFGFRDQIQRASVSIMNNVAEGFERDSDRDFVRFLFYAKASCGELRSMLYLAEDLNYLSHTEFEELMALSLETSKLISGLIKSLRK